MLSFAVDAIHQTLPCSLFTIVILSSESSPLACLRYAFALFMGWFPAPLCAPPSFSYLVSGFTPMFFFSFLFVVFIVFLVVIYSRWSFVAVPLLFFCPADHVLYLYWIGNRVLYYWAWLRPDRLPVI